MRLCSTHTGEHKRLTQPFKRLAAVTIKPMQMATATISWCSQQKHSCLAQLFTKPCISVSHWLGVADELHTPSVKPHRSMHGSHDMHSPPG